MEEERKSRSAFFVTYLLLVAFSVGAFIFLTHSLTPTSRDPPTTLERYPSAPAQRTKRQPSDEKTHNQAFCASVGGQTEVRHEYTYPTGQSYIRVDCETEDTVYEGSLDKRSSLDSVQQALFFAHLTGKEPAVVIYDTDGQIGKYEHRTQVACEAAGVRYLVKELNRPLTKAAMKNP